MTFSKNDFRDVPTGSGFFKMAARYLVKKEKNSKQREDISLKYQVLSPETAFVGVVKEDGKNDTIVKLVEDEQPVPELYEEMDFMTGAPPPMIMRKSMPRPMMRMRNNIMIKPTSMASGGRRHKGFAMIAPSVMPSPQPVMEMEDAAWGGDGGGPPVKLSAEELKKMKAAAEKAKKERMRAEKERLARMKAAKAKARAAKKAAMLKALL